MEINGKIHRINFHLFPDLLVFPDASMVFNCLPKFLFYAFNGKDSMVLPCKMPSLLTNYGFDLCSVSK